MSEWLPPDQIATKKFPIVGERKAAGFDFETWRLIIATEDAKLATFTLPQIMTFPQQDLLMDVHCVTRWSRLGTRFRGTPLKWLLHQFDPAAFIRFEAYSQRKHDSSLTYEYASKNAWLVHSADGQPLTEAHGGPLRIVTQGKYFYKSLKWLHRIELRQTDQLGYWERTDGYHNHADPWPGDERYVSGSLTQAEVKRFREATDYTRWQRRTIQGVDLSDWNPSTRELGALSLKNCDLRGAQLEGAQMAGANLSLSDLRSANLRGANLQDGDLEGAYLAAADLRGANLNGALLTATQFFDTNAEANVEGMSVTGASGLLEAQAAWLDTQLSPPSKRRG